MYMIKTFKALDFLFLGTSNDVDQLEWNEFSIYVS